jgi:hypothetical protein
LRAIEALDSPAWSADSGYIGFRSRASTGFSVTVAIVISVIAAGCQASPVAPTSSEIASVATCSESLVAWATSTEQFGKRAIRIASIPGGILPFTEQLAGPTCSFSSERGETQVALYVYESASTAKTTYQSLVESASIQPDYMLATLNDAPAQSTFTAESDQGFTAATVYIADDNFASYMGYAPTASIVVAYRAAASQ